MLRIGGDCSSDLVEGMNSLMVGVFLDECVLLILLNREVGWDCSSGLKNYWLVLLFEYLDIHG